VYVSQLLASARPAAPEVMRIPPAGLLLAWERTCVSAIGMPFEILTSPRVIGIRRARAAARENAGGLRASATKANADSLVRCGGRTNRRRGWDRENAGGLRQGGQVSASAT
jgi:hypothetical protein